MLFPTPGITDGETGKGEGLWHRLNRQMEIAPMNKCIFRHSVVSKYSFR